MSNSRRPATAAKRTLRRRARTTVDNVMRILDRPLEDVFSQDAIERILSATAETAVPNDIDRDALRRCLYLCVMWYIDESHHLNWTRRIRPQRRQLELVLKSLRRVELQMEKLYESFWTWDEKTIFAGWIERINRALAKMQENEANESYCSPFELLVGEFLPDAYALNFHRGSKTSPIYGRRYEQAYVRFAKAVLIELGLADYSSDAIRKALAVARGGGTRRRSADKPPNNYRERRRTYLVKALRGEPPSYSSPPYTIESEPGVLDTGPPIRSLLTVWGPNVHW
jgi:hypothetical protein